MGERPRVQGVGQAQGVRHIEGEGWTLYMGLQYSVPAHGGQDSQAAGDNAVERIEDMINLQEVYDMITSAFHETDDEFHWGDNAIIQGSIENYPQPDDIKCLSDAAYFALVDIESITPEEMDSPGLHKPNYHYSIILCHKAKTGDLTQIRNDIMTKFTAGWHKYWKGMGQWNCFVENIFPRQNDIETAYDCIAVQITGTISNITTKGGRFEERR